MTFEELAGLVEDAIGADHGTLTRDTRLAELDGWDSLAHLTVIAMLDSRGVSLKGKPLADLQTFGDLVAIVGA